MKQITFAVALGLCAVSPMPAFAKANCKAYPKAEWMKEAEAKAKIEAQGYTISKFKVDGNCYEIYGRNKAGKKVEIYFDAKTLEPVKSEIEK
ncbi:PepSY domain-containing protein [Variovorax paradoxus]|nr:PepSY domain-containing protein [Variovorax paradoxus]